MLVEKKKKKIFGNKSSIIVSVIVLLLATLFCVLGFIEVATVNKMELVTASITRIEKVGSGADTTHYVYVKYNFRDTDYDNVEISWYSASMYVGKQITIYVDPNNPEHILSKKSAYLMAIVGAAIVVGMFAYFISRFAIRGAYLARIKKLTEANNYIICKVDYVSQDKKMSTDRYWNTLNCSSEDGNQYRSDLFISDHNFCSGDLIKVYIDHDNPRNYYVDLSRDSEE